MPIVPRLRGLVDKLPGLPTVLDQLGRMGTLSPTTNVDIIIRIERTWGENAMCVVCGRRWRWAADRSLELAALR